MDKKFLPAVHAKLVGTTAATFFLIAMVIAQWKYQDIAYTTIANVVSQPTVSPLGSMASSNANLSSLSNTKETTSMDIVELKSQGVASTATARVASTPAVSQAGITTGSQSAVLGKSIYIISVIYFTELQLCCLSTLRTRTSLFRVRQAIYSL